MPDQLDETVVIVFAAGPGGGNPAPIVLAADGLSDEQMQAVARRHGHESAFVVAAPPASEAAFGLRFWVPNHEMTMCGHATVAAVWLLAERGWLGADRVVVATASGPVPARIQRAAAGGHQVEIAQPPARVEPIDPQAGLDVLAVLGLHPDELGPWPLRNATTSRTKTLVPVADEAVLDRLAPDYSRIEATCDRLGSTGLYPYAPVDLSVGLVAARQFPRASGYPEDPATGVAAAALAFGLRHDGALPAHRTEVRVRQGRAMGRPSEITVRLDPAGGCWLSGAVSLVE
jgi:PhzF family phenazine biosynthesis protein